MIRDPSDGSVKAPAAPRESALAPEQNHTRNERVRLDKSREWLKKYHEPKPETPAEEAAE